MNAHKYEVLTPDGWSNFSGLKSKEIPKYISITTNIGTSLKCSLNHPILTVNGFEEVQDLKIGDTICTKDAFEVITEIKIHNHKVIVYDLLDVEKESSYFTNNIVSHNCVGFMGSSGTLISGAKLKELFIDIKPPIERNDGYGYKVWKMPRRDRIYSIIVDVSRGKGLDYSAFQVIDITETPYQQAATFKNNMITPSDYASFIYQTAKAYNDAYALIEINDIGGQVADILGLDYGYENVIYTESAGAKGRRVSTGFGGNTIDSGIRTTKTVKSLGCSMLKLLIEQNTLEIYDADTINELAVFSKQGDSYEAEAGFNDDLVICLVLLSWLTTDTYFKHLNDSDIMHSLRDLTDAQIYESLVPFGIIHGAWDDDEPVIEKIGGENWTLQDYDAVDNMGNNW